MKKYILIFIGLIIVGLAIGGGIAYWNVTGRNNDLSQVSKQEQNTETEYNSNEENLKKQLAKAKTIEEYKEEFIKDKKYKENCLGDKPIDYSMFDKNDINAANQAVACYQLKYDKKRGTKEAEEGYLDFLKFGFYFSEKHFDLMQCAYNIVVYKDSMQISSVKIIEELLDRIFYKFGLKAVYGELEFYPEISDIYIYENIAPYLSSEWQILLAFETKLEHPISTFNGYFRITKCELEGILQYYNDFDKEYPKFSKEQKIPNRIKYYEKALITYPKVPN